MNTKISEKFKELIQTQDDILNRRKEWDNNTKLIIKQSFNEVRNVIGDEIYLSEKTVASGYEAISLTFGNTSSGIVSKNTNGFTAYAKDGGALLYLQRYDGKVSVVIKYPSIENIVDEREKLLIDSYEPAEITILLIAEHVEKFLDEMIKWEKGGFLDV